MAALFRASRRPRRTPRLASRRPWRGRWIVLTGIVLVGLNLRIAVGAVSPILDVDMKAIERVLAKQAA